MKGIIHVRGVVAVAAALAETGVPETTRSLFMALRMSDVVRTTPEFRRGFALALTLAAITAAPAAASHPIPESQRWATVTHAGNAAYFHPDRFPNGVGRVDYEYQISRTEVTVGEWVEFLQAFAPFAPEDEWFSITLTSRWIAVAGYRQYVIGNPAFENLGVEIAWRNAARYCNWLHNGKAATREAFESGAYDTSTFFTNPDGTFTDQAVRSPGATYWIPNADEWTKAAYFDPNRYGDAQPGYWNYPTTSDVLPPFGLPAQGGLTSRSLSNRAPDVASYRNVQSPWGLWDTSGSASEWLEDAYPSANPNVRLTRGSSRWDDRYSGEQRDELNRLWSDSPLRENGLRIARIVPAPSSILLLSGVAFILGRGRRR